MKFKKKILLVAAMICATIFTLYTTFNADGISFSMNDADTQVLGTFKEKRVVNELFSIPAGANLFNITAYVMSDKVSGVIWNAIQEKGRTGVRTISIKYSTGPFAYLANGITLGIWAPVTLTREGEVIKTTSSSGRIDTELSITKAVETI